MSTIYTPTRPTQTTGLPRRFSGALREFWGELQDRRKRARLRADLCSLNDRELMDIGIARGEIDYVASNRNRDPRGIRSAG
jgi:uncharacterized protein YjiS (DUF1127 family)